ncbi:hypothetical protein [Thermaerobacillus caldiproteolyticus]|uniref:hypothetical protein n=1 Tax=Thermaerobacillus caldiproteolyticus TaxID=247480 RepID=UPI00188B414B|nr:hypothetical protein [Anoxybacillus caldiproteolyticus]QPA33385.1 hypothetical protein ISX45_19230 [Anoxybacillus caldiproteolyticus]
MFEWISRADNLVEIVRSIKSPSELKALKEFLSDETNTQMLRDSQVYVAIRDIPSHARHLLEDIIDLLY